MVRLFKRSLILFFFFFLALPGLSFGQQFSNWEIDVDLQENGDAIITNTWSTIETTGTEKFLPITNLGDSEIQDYVVSENGQTFEFVEDWNSDWSREEKAGKSGILKVKDGYELVFGIGEYDAHDYVFQYRITNMVKNLKDGQSLYWRFVNDAMTPPPDKFTITFHAPVDLNTENTKMWAFGYPGEINTDGEGQIVARSTGQLTSNDYGVVLLQFPEGLFQTDSNLNKTTDEQREQAFEGSDYKTQREKQDRRDRILMWVMIAAVVLSVFSTFAAIAFSIFSFYRSNKYTRRAKRLKGEYFKEPPYEGAFEDLIYILSFNRTYAPSNLITVYFLKWIREGALETSSYEAGAWIFKTEDLKMRFLKEPNFESSSEKRLYEIFIQAKGSEDSLTLKNLNRFIRNHKSKLLSFISQAQNQSKKTMLEKGYLQGKGNNFKNTEKTELTPKGLELFDNNVRFQNYLKDYSLLNERGNYDVTIWDNLMLYAALYGITEEVQKQFESLEPNYIDQSSFDSRSVYWASTVSRQTYSQTVSDSASSGGGGSSSSGGGGGSFGGGSGGGSR